MLLPEKFIRRRAVGKGKFSKLELPLKQTSAGIELRSWRQPLGLFSIEVMRNILFFILDYKIRCAFINYCLFILYQNNPYFEVLISLFVGNHSLILVRILYE